MNTLLIKDPNAKVKVHKNYLELFKDGQKYVIGLMHVSEVYLHKNIPLLPTELIAIARQKPLFFVDHHGYIIARLEIEK